MRNSMAVLMVSACVVAAGELTAQTPAQPVAHRAVFSVHASKPEEVASIYSVIASHWDVISRSAGQVRDWNRMRSLFIPGGRLMPTGVRPDRSVVVRILEVNDYIAVSGPQLERVGFREREIARRTEQFGHIAHVFSTYEGRLDSDGTVIRGI